MVIGMQVFIFYLFIYSFLFLFSFLFSFSFSVSFSVFLFSPFSLLVSLQSMIIRAPPSRGFTSTIFPPQILNFFKMTAQRLFIPAFSCFRVLKDVAQPREGVKKEEESSLSESVPTALASARVMSGCAASVRAGAAYSNQGKGL